MEKAFVCVSTEPACIPQVIQKIKCVEGVEDVEMVYGDYDVCFKVEEATLDGLRNKINEKIRKIGDVRNTLTTIIVH